jgi:hypothetical protein
MKKTPLQLVQETFGSREKLVDELVKTADRHPDDDSDAQTRSRLMGLSNSKLLRLIRVEQTVRERFGDRDKLVDHIIETRRAAGHTADDAYRAKLDTYGKARLLDLTRIKYGEPAVKLTPEQRLKAKRGKKQRERALAKLNA